jgi:hypothetical protein
VSQGPDLSHFVQHRQLDVYEQSMARQGYAYGVDLRRSRWLTSSTIGNALVRAVDRAWPELAEHLEGEVLREFRIGDRSDRATPNPAGLLRELAGLMNLLRAPLPTVKLLRADQRGRWPLVTPLGATRGGALWLIVDVDALAAVPADQRAFLLGSALGHLHCDHAVFFTAHLLADRREGNVQIRTLRSAMIPWTKVMVFSADRAGLIACGRLETAISMIESPPIAVGDTPDPDMHWLPKLAPPAVRIRALEEFARSAVFARITTMRARQRELARNVTLLEPAPGTEDRVHVPAEAWSLARVDARLTARLNLL